MGYEVLFSVDKNATKSNFYFQKFWKDFGDYKHIKTQIAAKKACAMHVSRLNSIFSIYFRLTYMKKHEKEQNNLFV